MTRPGTDSRWRQCKNLLCVRTDNMGDIIMSGPAIRLLRQYIGCRVTLLTSVEGAPIAPYIPGVDNIITARYPWTGNQDDNAEDMFRLIETIRAGAFDGAIIFTVYSQSALPAALMLYLAGIPLRLAYAHENPYHLLTDWAADHEPFSFSRHQVQRDTALLQQIGIDGEEGKLSLRVPASTNRLEEKRSAWNLLPGCPFIILHPGVSEKKREYPLEYWEQIVTLLTRKYSFPVVVTGSAPEKNLAASLCSASPAAINAAGELSVGEWISLVAGSSLVISVNTSTIHIAAALQVPALVLYAMTNPQHTPWKSPHAVLPFSLLPEAKSINPIIRYVDRHHYGDTFVPVPTPELVMATADRLLRAAMLT